MQPTQGGLPGYSTRWSMVGSTSAGATDRYPAHCASVYSTVKGRYCMRWCLPLFHPLIESQDFFQASDSDLGGLDPRGSPSPFRERPLVFPIDQQQGHPLLAASNLNYHHWVPYSKQWANQPQKERFSGLLYFSIYFSVLTKVSQVYVSNAKQMPFCFHSLEEIQCNVEVSLGLIFRNNKLHASELPGAI